MRCFVLCCAIHKCFFSVVVACLFKLYIRVYMCMHFRLVLLGMRIILVDVERVGSRYVSQPFVHVSWYVFYDVWSLIAYFSAIQPFRSYSKLANGHVQLWNPCSSLCAQSTKRNELEKINILEPHR